MCTGPVTTPFYDRLSYILHSPADAALFVGDDDEVDQTATAEAFLLVTGLSSIGFGVAFNLPFIVAPSVLYAGREAGYVGAGRFRHQR